jgi:hypothetical protein
MFRPLDRWMDSDMPTAGTMFREMTEQWFRHNLLMRLNYGSVERG